MRTLFLTLTIYLIAIPAYAQYSGGTGEPNDPYQIATAEDLMLLGETPEDYDKHFILTADIDLDPNLPGRKVFDRAVIAPDTDPTLNEYGDQLYDGIAFTGTFDGNGHTISHLTITGNSYLALFGQLDFTAEVNDLGLVDVNIIGSGWYIGGVAGENLSWSYQSGGSVTNCYSNGAVSGNTCVGGLVGRNEYYVTCCHSSGVVSGDNWNVGGLVGSNNYYGIITASYSTATVSGGSCIGGLAGDNSGCVRITNSYSTGVITGDAYAGALVGYNGGNNRCYSSIGNCYSIATVMGAGECVGGLVGSNWDYGQKLTACFWDPQNSGQANAEMQMAQTFLDVGWDFVGETENGTDDIWKIAEGMGYPRLWWEKYSGGTGEPNDPYQIATDADLITLGENPNDYDKCFILIADIDLDPNLPGRKVFDRAIIAPDMNDATEWFDGIAFAGVFDGNGHTLSHLTINGQDCLGLFGRLEFGAEVKYLAVVDVNITSLGDYVGGLVGYSDGGTVIQCYSTGTVSGNDNVGGLVGSDHGSIITCSSSGSVSGSGYVGGLVGYEGGNIDSSHSGTSVSGTNQVGGLVGYNYGSIVASYSTGLVSGANDVGGLAGVNSGTMTSSYSMSSVTGDSYVGGLVGANGGYGFRGGCFMGMIYDCYATGAVVGIDYVAGLVGYNMGDVIRCYSSGAVTAATTNVSGLVLPGGECGGYDEPAYRVDYVDACFWDIEASGQPTSSGGGIGKTTAEIQDPNTYMAVGWDFIGQSDGPHDIWIEAEGGGYPILWWCISPLAYLPQFSGGTGTSNDPYIISTPEELKSIGHNPRLMRCHLKLVTDLDLTGCHFYPIGDSVYPYTGVFDGDSYTISNLTIQGGLFGWVAGCDSEIRNCRLVDPNVEWAGGALVDWLENGSIINCNIRGAKISGASSVGGLVGYCQEGHVINCIVEDCTVSGYNSVGGLVGSHQRGTISDCSVHSGRISADSTVGGLAGEGHGTIIRCSVWDTEVLVENPFFGRVGGLLAYGGGTAARIQDCQVNGGVARGTGEVGGLVGWMTRGTIAGCRTSTRVEASAGDGKNALGLLVGGLAGSNGGTMQDCYSASSLSQGGVAPGMDWLFTSGAGGLAGYNSGTIDRSYSTGFVTGTLYVGGLVGKNAESKGSVTGCFWDMQTSGQSESAGGAGLTTAKMQAASTFLEAGWDFIDETANGTNDIWWILEGKDYPRLWWETTEQ